MSFIYLIRKTDIFGSLVLHERGQIQLNKSNRKTWVTSMCHNANCARPFLYGACVPFSAQACLHLTITVWEQKGQRYQGQQNGKWWIQSKCHQSRKSLQAH